MTENIKCDEILEKKNFSCKCIFLKPITEEEIGKNIDRLKNIFLSIKFSSSNTPLTYCQ